MNSVHWGSDDNKVINCSVMYIRKICVLRDRLGEWFNEVA